MPNLCEVKDVKLFIGSKDDSSDELLALLCSAASEIIRAQCGLDFNLTAYSEIRNGFGREVIFAMNPPIATSPAPTVTENGIALVAVFGYSATADVLVDPSSGAFYRQYAGRAGRWRQGRQNVTLNYTGGYSTIPEDLSGLARYLAASFWKQLDKKEINVAQRAMGQMSTNSLKDLPARYQMILDAYSRPMVPEN